MVLTATMAATRARAGAATKLRQRRQQATPVGQAIIDRVLELGLTMAEAAEKVGLTPGALRHLIFSSRWRRRWTQENLAAFLRQPTEEVQALLPGGAINPHKKMHGVRCDQCREPIERSRSQVEVGLHNFCSRACYWGWERDRRKVRRPESARGKLRPGGRLQARILREGERPAIYAVSRATGFSTVSLYRRLHGGSSRLIVTYALEKWGLIAATARPALAVGILDFCLEERTKPVPLASKAGIANATMTRVLRTGQAKPGVIRKLAAAMGCRPEDLAVLRAGTYRRQPKRRGRGRPPTFTAAQAREVCRLRDQELPVPWPEIGRRMGWRLKMDRRGVPCDCPMARRAYAVGVRLQPASP